MFKRVLVPLDRSEFAEKVLVNLPRFIDPANTEILLLGVLETLRYATPAFEYTPLLINEMHTGYKTYLQTIQQQLQKAGYRVLTQLAEGDAAEQILDVATHAHADLIAMATHGRSGLTRWALGSVAERVSQSSTLPVLLMRGQADLPHGKIERILVPLDGSILAEKALTHAQTLAKENGAELLLFQGIPFIDVEDEFAQIISAQQLESADVQAFANAEAYLISVALRLRGEGIACQTVVLRGDPARLICDVANESKIDVVAICTHGRTGFSRWMYGSVANQVIRGVECPVLVVRGMQLVESKAASKAAVRIGLGEPLAA
ncbi:MAG: universal stress protein [Chloroflexi bacterium]|nr:universal stress protein [Chloroflexota bacterium]